MLAFTVCYAHIHRKKTTCAHTHTHVNFKIKGSYLAPEISNHTDVFLTISICAVTDVPRPRKRLTELMLKTALEIPGEKEQERRAKASRIWAFRFFRSPVEILADLEHNRTAGIRLAINRLEVNRIWILKLKKSLM